MPKLIFHTHVSSAILVINDAACEVDKQLATYDAILQQLKLNLQNANNRMKQMADAHRCDIEFQVGD